MVVPALLVPIALSLPGLAAGNRDDTGNLDDAEADPGVSADGQSWFVLPGAFYSQETSLGFAAYGSATFPLRGTGASTWPSSLGAAVVYTLQQQASLAVWPSFYLGRSNDWVVTGEAILSHYPTRYFGIGGDADPAWQDLTRRWFKTEAVVLRRVEGPLYLGLVDGVSVTELREIGAPEHNEGAVSWIGADVLGSGQVTGEEGGVVHGLGVALRHERRDNDQSTRSGTLLDVRTRAHGTWLGSDYRFLEAVVDARAFHTLAGDWTLAAQWVSELRSGAVPFTHMAELGGDDLLRGMYEGRYRDRSATAMQAELRVPIYWRFRGVAFGGLGQVFSVPEDLLAVPPRWTAGGGLRFEIDEVSRSTLRLDLGAGPDGLGFIFNFGEAF